MGFGPGRPKEGFGAREETYESFGPGQERFDNDQNPGAEVWFDIPGEQPKRMHLQANEKTPWKVFTSECPHRVCIRQDLPGRNFRVGSKELEYITHISERLSGRDLCVKVDAPKPGVHRTYRISEVMMIAGLEDPYDPKLSQGGFNKGHNLHATGYAQQKQTMIDRLEHDPEMKSMSSKSDYFKPERAPGVSRHAGPTMYHKEYATHAMATMPPLMKSMQRDRGSRKLNPMEDPEMGPYLSLFELDNGFQFCVSAAFTLASMMLVWIGSKKWWNPARGFQECLLQTS